MKKFYLILTISNAKTIETWKLDDFMQKLKTVVRIALYGPAVTQSDSAIYWNELIIEIKECNN